MSETFEEIFIPEAVHEEILKGTEFGSADVPVIENAINDGWIIVNKTKDEKEEEKLLRGLPQNLGAGEKQAIVLMIKMQQRRKIGADWLLMDDEVASKTARSIGLAVRAISYLPIFWTGKGLVQPSEALQMLDDLVREGYRLGTKDYVSIKEIILKGE